ncbi:MAG: hypothetical protein ABSA47_15690 [Verrucomicrobiota bacterium]|jgi:hypothetical protein
MFRDYKYTIKFGRRTSVIQKRTGITWDELVDVMANNKLSLVDEIRFHHQGCPNGMSQIGGAEMLQLWKAVNRNQEERDKAKLKEAEPTTE